MLQKFVGTLSDKYEIPAIDTDEIEKNSELTLDGGFDFNSMWNSTYRNQVGRASMKGQIFYLDNFLQDSMPTGNNGKEQTMSFMKNIAIFTRWYSLSTKINDEFGNFVSPKS